MAGPGRRVRAVLFDVDGTLVDSIPFLVDCFRGSVHEVLGRAVPDGVELSVRDQCGGLSADEMERVFDVAWRGAPARTPTLAEGEEAAPDLGAGLGLAIVKGIVEAHRGVVGVENVGTPAGCRFTVLLPV